MQDGTGRWVRGLLAVSVGLGIAGCQGGGASPQDLASRFAVTSVSDDSRTEAEQRFAPAQFTVTNYAVPPGTKIGHLNPMPVVRCYAPSEEFFWHTARGDLHDAKYARLVNGTLESAGFNMVDASGSAFGRRQQRAPVYEIGMTIEDFYYEYCDAGMLPDYAFARMKIRFEVFSIPEDAVVFEETVSVKTDTETFTGRITPYGFRTTIPRVMRETIALGAERFAESRQLRRIMRRDPTVEARLAYSETRSGWAPLTLPAIPISRTPVVGRGDALERSAVLLTDGRSHGSGFFVSDQGHILTNAHVVGNESRITVRTYDGKERIGRVERVDRRRDAALVKLPETGPYPVLPIRPDSVRVADEVYAVGAPKRRDYQGTVSKGIVSRLFDREDGLPDIQADVDVHGGNSGGPLLDENGNVVGITYRGLEMGPDKTSVGLNVFIPIGNALERLNIGLPGTVRTSALE